MARTKLPPEQKQKYLTKFFYYPISPKHEVVWNYFETMLSDASNPRSPRYNPKLNRGTVIRRLVLKYIAEEIGKKRTAAGGRLPEVDELVLNSIREIIVEEDEKINKRIERARMNQRRR